MTFTNTLEATLDLPTIQLRISEVERLGAQLTEVAAKTHKGQNFTQVTFDELMPNKGPYSVILPTTAPPPSGKERLFESEAFIDGEQTSVVVYR